MKSYFDGQKFVDSDNPMNKTFKDVWRFFLSGERCPWPSHILLLQHDKPPNRIEDSRLRVSFVNHATVLLQTEGLNILTDPVWSKRVSPISFIGPSRLHEPGIAFEDLPRIDVVLVSHNHYDHLDLPTLKRLHRKFKPLIFTGLKVSQNILPHIPQAQIIELDWEESYELKPNQRIHFLKSQHWSARSIFDRNHTLWGSFCVELPGGNLYFAGDTGYGPHFKAIQKQFEQFRLALLPIGAYEPRWMMQYQHMNPQEAVQAFHDLKAEQALAIHHGCFRLTYEGHDHPSKELLSLSEPNFKILKPGEFLVCTEHL